MEVVATRPVTHPNNIKISRKTIISLERFFSPINLEPSIVATSANPSHTSDISIQIVIAI